MYACSPDHNTRILHTKVRQFVGWQVLALPLEEAHTLRQATALRVNFLSHQNVHVRAIRLLAHNDSLKGAASKCSPQCDAHPLADIPNPHSRRWARSAAQQDEACICRVQHYARAWCHRLASLPRRGWQRVCRPQFELRRRQLGRGRQSSSGGHGTASTSSRHVQAAVIGAQASCCGHAVRRRE